MMSSLARRPLTSRWSSCILAELRLLPRQPGLDDLEGGQPEKVLRLYQDLGITLLAEFEAAAFATTPLADSPEIREAYRPPSTSIDGDAKGARSRSDDLAQSRRPPSLESVSGALGVTDRRQVDCGDQPFCATGRDATWMRRELRICSHSESHIVARIGPNLSRRLASPLSWRTPA